MSAAARPIPAATAHGPSEGTWGWDYVGGRSVGSRIFINWSHRQRYQGGYGKYETEGPKPVEHLIETIHGEKGKE